MERPSNYKHHSTMKFLIGITPQGTVSFVSRCAGGRISDKEITEQAEVKMPPFTKGKKQLEKQESRTFDCENTR